MTRQKRNNRKWKTQVNRHWMITHNQENIKYKKIYQKGNLRTYIKRRKIVYDNNDYNNNNNNNNKHQ